MPVVATLAQVLAPPLILPTGVGPGLWASSSIPVATAPPPPVVAQAIIFLPQPPQVDHPPSSVRFIREMREREESAIKVREELDARGRPLVVPGRLMLKPPLEYVPSSAGHGQALVGSAFVRNYEYGFTESDFERLEIAYQDELSLMRNKKGKISSQLNNHAPLVVELRMISRAASAAEIQLDITVGKSEHPVEATLWCRHFYRTIILPSYPRAVAIVETYEKMSLGAWFIFFHSHQSDLTALFTRDVYDDFARVLSQPGADFFVPSNARREDPGKYLDDVRHATRTLELIRKMITIGKDHHPDEAGRWCMFFFDTVINPAIVRGVWRKCFAGLDRFARFSTFVRHADFVAEAFATVVYSDFASVISLPGPDYVAPEIHGSSSAVSGDNDDADSVNAPSSPSLLKLQDADRSPPQHMDLSEELHHLTNTKKRARGIAADESIEQKTLESADKRPRAEEVEPKKELADSQPSGKSILRLESPHADTDQNFLSSPVAHEEPPPDVDRLLSGNIFIPDSTGPDGPTPSSDLFPPSPWRPFSPSMFLIASPDPAPQSPSVPVEHPLYPDISTMS